MSRKVCYITTLPITLKAFVVKSAIYNKKNRDWDITFICDETPGFQKELPEGIRYIPVRIKRGVSLSGFVSTIRLFKVFKKEKFDLVQYSTSNAGCYASIAAFLARIPVRLYCQWGLDYPAFSGIKIQTYRRLNLPAASYSQSLSVTRRQSLKKQSCQKNWADTFI